MLEQGRGRWHAMIYRRAYDARYTVKTSHNGPTVGHRI